VPINTRQKRFLRGKTHHLNPVVMIAEKGLSENVLNELESALEHHELIKVKLRTDRDARSAMIREIEERFGAELVHKIGQVACFYRRNPEKPVIELPK
jgi:RNA-binding protein